MYKKDRFSSPFPPDEPAILRMPVRNDAGAVVRVEEAVVTGDEANGLLAGTGGIGYSSSNFRPETVDGDGVPAERVHGSGDDFSNCDGKKLSDGMRWAQGMPYSQEDETDA